MELEELITDVESIEPKTGFGTRLTKIRESVQTNGNIIEIETDGFGNHENHSNHSDWENRTRRSELKGQPIRLKTITLKAVSEICGHTDHSDHNDFTDSREV